MILRLTRPLDMDVCLGHFEQCTVHINTVISQLTRLLDVVVCFGHFKQCAVHINTCTMIFWFTRLLEVDVCHRHFEQRTVYILQDRALRIITGSPTKKNVGCPAVKLCAKSQFFLSPIRQKLVAYGTQTLLGHSPL